MSGISRKKHDLSVAVIQPAYAKYRQPLFDKLDDSYNTTLYFIEETAHYLQSATYTRTEHKSTAQHGKPLIYHMVLQTRRYFTLLSQLLKGKFSVVITSLSDSPQTIISLFASKMRRSKCILWSEDWFMPGKKSWRFWVTVLPLIILRAHVVRSVDAVIVEGTPQYKYVRNLNVPAEKVFFSNHCSLDYSVFGSRDLKRELGIDGSIVILYLGRIIENKGLDVLIRAFSRLEQERSDAALMICGDGDFRSHCERLSDELKLKRVLFLGQVHGEELIASCYKSADIFVLPSRIKTYERFWTEGWGLSINEAMSMAKPVVTTNAVGAAADLVKDGVNGYVVQQGNCNALYQALRRIVEDSSTRDVMGKNSRRLFEEFNDFGKMFEGFKKAIEYVTRQ